MHDELRRNGQAYRIFKLDTFCVIDFCVGGWVSGFVYVSVYAEWWVGVFVCVCVCVCTCVHMSECISI